MRRPLCPGHIDHVTIEKIIVLGYRRLGLPHIRKAGDSEHLFLGGGFFQARGGRKASWRIQLVAYRDSEKTRKIFLVTVRQVFCMGENSWVCM